MICIHVAFIHKINKASSQRLTFCPLSRPDLGRQEQSMYETISPPLPSGYEVGTKRTMSVRKPIELALEGTTSLTPPPQGPDDGPFRLEDIKMALICHA